MCLDKQDVRYYLLCVPTNDLKGPSNHIVLVNLYGRHSYSLAGRT